MQRRANGANEFVSAGVGDLWRWSGSKEPNGLAAQKHGLGRIVGEENAAAAPRRGRSGSDRVPVVEARWNVAHCACGSLPGRSAEQGFRVGMKFNDVIILYDKINYDRMTQEGNLLVRKSKVRLA